MDKSTRPSSYTPSNPSGKANSAQDIGGSNSSRDPLTISTMGKNVERAEMSPRSFSDPAIRPPTTSNLPRSNSESYKPLSSPTSPRGKRISRQSLMGEPIEEEESSLPKKRYSGTNHTNLHTECGRHGDDWLVGPMIDTVKDVVKSLTGGKSR